jgi:penicillin-binding protein 2
VRLLDPQERQRQLIVRTWQLAALGVLGFVVVLVGYWYVQVLRGSYYRELAENNRLRDRPIQAPRGLILDREGRALVENVPSYHLLLDRSRAADLQESVLFLSRILGLSPSEIAERLAGYDSVPSFKPVLLAEDLSLDQVAAIEAMNLEHPELEIDVRQRRFYRHGTQTAHVVGYLGEAGEGTLERRPNLSAGDRIGVKGVEQTFDSLLRGADGRQVVVVDSRGKLVREHLREPGVSGTDVTLTLDLDLQQEAERFFQGKVGSAVAMDPRSGEILAMVSSPSYNSNAFARRLDSREWREIVGGEFHPLQNRAIQNAYPPGSVFKIVSAIAALEEGLVGTEETFFCGGAARIYNHRFRCWKGAGHGSVTLREALQHSCDVFFYHLGPRLKIERIADWSRRLGLGVPTGIDLQGEKSGLVPDREWSLRVRKSIWFPGETISVVIGQGPLLVTPLQVAVMMSAVANGGRLVRPHVVRDTHLGRERDLQLEPSTLEIVRDALSAVVNEQGGTGSSARLAGLEVAGKTGTAQVIRQPEEIASEDLPYRFRDHAWFASFAPVEGAEMVVVVFVEHGGHGSTAAAPLAKLLYERHFGTPVIDSDT